MFLSLTVLGSIMNCFIFTQMSCSGGTHQTPWVHFLQTCFQDIVYSNFVAVKRKLPFLNSLYTSLFQYFIILIQCKSVFILWALEVCEMIVPVLVQERQETCHNKKKPTPQWQQLLVAQATWCINCHFPTEVWLNKNLKGWKPHNAFFSISIFICNFEYISSIQY